MIKKMLTSFALLICLASSASEYEKLDYKNIENGEHITFSQGFWSNKVKRKNSDYIVKNFSNDDLNYSEFYSPNGELLFSTGTEYEFIHKGSLIGYSNSDLKFYEFDFKDNNLFKRELSIDEVQELFPKHQIILISQFSKTTNCLKLKKSNKNLRLLLLNDTTLSFYNYKFNSNNAEYKLYELLGFIDIQHKGMIQFSRTGDDSADYPWYVLLIR